MTEREYLILIGKNITKIRKQRGITSKELGYQCDMEKSNLIPIEKGRINTTIGTLIKIAKALDVDIADFLKR
ncbi:MAG TPA: helix-turn-helix transcriptional regulator [Bacteroidia bacterium]|jgi:transcriptional regulator with XRE-family HTH domain|nr:helix-turn-helix transcriptional regulator [Bacteroidia bacterium]